MAEKESEMKKMQAENNKLKESRKEKIDEGHKERERYEKEISQVQVEKQSLEEQKDSLNRTIEDLSSALKAEQKKTNKLAGHLEENRSELDKIKEENKMYVVKISQLETEKQTLQDQIDTLNKTNEEMVPNMEDQHHEMEKLKRKLGSLHVDPAPLFQFCPSFSGTLNEKDEKSLMEDCRRLKKKEVVMRVLRASRSGVGKTMMKTVTDVLARQLRRRLDSRHFDFTIDFPDILADVSKGPLFLVCLNSTVGKNVPDALEGPKGGRDVYLLVLHQITTENLSTLRPDSLRNTGSELRQLGGVIDMVFSSESGFSSESCLWECDINSTAVEKIVTVLKKI